MQVTPNTTYASLLQDFAALNIEPTAPRETGVIDMVNMPWNAPECRLSHEYKDIYCSRLTQMKGMFNTAGVTTVDKVLENKQNYIVIGILKRIEVNRVRAFEKNFYQKYDNQDPIYSEKDELQVEDLSGKTIVSLSSDCAMGPLKPVRVQDLPYGIVVKMEGRFRKQSNRFVVRSITLPSPPPQRPLSMVEHMGTDRKLLVLSEPSVEYLEKVASEMGNTFSPLIHSIVGIVIVGGIQMKPEVIKRVSQLIDSLKEAIDVFIMPSSNRQRQGLFPLPPYNGIFFPNSQRKIGLCSNPQLFQAHTNLQVHVSCGQNVQNLLKNGSLIKDEMQAMEMMVQCAHYSPTAPFSLKCEPYMEDFMVMQEMPHVVVAGGARDFSVRRFQVEEREVLLVSVKQGEAGLVSLDRVEATAFV